MEERNKAIVRSFYAQVWNEGDVEAADLYLDVEFVDHTALPGLGTGIDGFKRLVHVVRNAFPDLHVTVEDAIAEHDRVVCMWTAAGTYQGALLGPAPSGEHMSVDGIDVMRLADGKIVEHWGRVDIFGLMQQLDMLPHLALAGA